MSIIRYIGFLGFACVATVILILVAGIINECTRFFIVHFGVVVPMAFMVAIAFVLLCKFYKESPTKD